MSDTFWQDQKVVKEDNEWTVNGLVLLSASEQPGYWTALKLLDIALSTHTKAKLQSSNCPN
jgi:hypothetical protein